MTTVSPVDTVLLDVGGVILTNGWDRHARAQAIERFGLDPLEFADRHDLVADAFETGRMTLDEYLERTVFYRPRPFERQDFIEAMQAASAPLPGGFALLDELTASGMRLFTLNNESRELHRFRMEAFELRRWFQGFFTSGYLGVRKPDREIFRIALEVSGRDPAEVVFVDDRAVNVECAVGMGLPTVLWDGAPPAWSDLRRAIGGDREGG